MSVIDGGIFKCGNHDEEYTTNDLEEWVKHLQSHENDDNVTMRRSGACVVCNKPVIDHETGVNMNPIHQDCANKVASRAAATARSTQE